MVQKLTEKLKTLSTTAGVYLYKNKSGRIIYVGKASNLKNRVRSYFNEKESYTSTHAKLTSEIANFEIIKTESEIEALILEANLIKKFKPKYNIALRDDKNYFFVAVTNNEFPRIFITHQPFNNLKLKIKNLKFDAEYIGPFTDGISLKIVLKMLRKIFPYCTCKNMHKRSCMNANIGLCMDICCNQNFLTPRSVISKTPRYIAWGKENPTLYSVGGDNTNDLSTYYNDLRKKYLSNIKNISEILKGNKQKILKNIEKEMKLAAKKEEYEIALKYKKQIASLERIFKHQNIVSDPLVSLKVNWSKISDGLKKLLGIKKEIKRMEAYDISNIGGKYATGSMVVFENGLPNKNEYRQFKIYGSLASIDYPNDYAMIQEILQRRFRHPEWRLPEIILIDGGKGQLNAAKQVIPKGIAALSLSKNRRAKKLAKGDPFSYKTSEKQGEILFSKRFFKGLPIKNLPQNIQNLFLNLRDEAHRFAIKLHRKIRNKNLLK